MSDHLKHYLDLASVGAAVSAFVGWLPSIAALLSIIWSLIRFYEWAVEKFHSRADK